MKVWNYSKFLRKLPPMLCHCESSFVETMKVGVLSQCVPCRGPLSLVVWPRWHPRRLHTVHHTPRDPKRRRNTWPIKLIKGPETRSPVSVREIDTSLTLVPLIPSTNHRVLHSWPIPLTHLTPKLVDGSFPLTVSDQSQSFDPVLF